MKLFIKKEPETKALAVSQPTTTALVTKSDVDSWLRTFGVTKDLLPNEVEAFTTMATMMNLNPFKKEIHVVAYGNKADPSKRTLAIMTGYEVYIERAEATGKLEDWWMEEADPNTPIEKYWARVCVKRTDRNKVQNWIVYYAESVQNNSYGKPNANWKKQPRFMTKKTAISQGFRLFFKGALSGLPNTADEMPDYSERNITPDPVAIPKDTAKPAETTQTVEAVEAPAKSRKHFDDQTVPEEAEVVPVEPEIQEMNYFHEVIALVNKSDLPAMAIGECAKGKMDYIREAKEHINDQNLLKDLYNDLVRDCNG